MQDVSTRCQKKLKNFCLYDILNFVMLKTKLFICSNLHKFYHKKYAYLTIMGEILKKKLSQ